jgi:CHAD domain-containing protein
VQSHLRQQHRALVRGDIELRRGGDVVHPTRVATRRLRSALRVFDLFDPERAAHLDAELKWYAGVLGEVRDLQVLRGHLLDRAAALPADVSNHTATYLRTRLADDERTKLAELLEVLDGDRYRSLLREVRAFVEQAPRGRKRSAKKVRRYVQQARRKAVKRVASAARLPDDDASTHQARKAAKRGRYTAELAVATLGKQAERIADEQRRVQNKLGHLQDAVVAAGHIERITPRAAGRSGFGLGLLWSGEQDRADKTRRSLPNLAKRLAG